MACCDIPTGARPPRLHATVGERHNDDLDDEVDVEDEEGPVGEVDEPLGPLALQRPVVRDGPTQDNPHEEVDGHDDAIHEVYGRVPAPLCRQREWVDMGMGMGRGRWE